jgi:hypothetical protein
MRIEYRGLTFEVPAGWADVTRHLPPGTPFTLGTAAVCGVVQFSVFKSDGQRTPGTTQDFLKQLFIEICRSRSFGEVEPVILTTSRIPCVGNIVSTPKEVVGMWLLSAGSDIGFVTYTGREPGHPSVEEELPDAIEIVKSIELA